MKKIKVKLGKGCQIYFDPSQNVSLCVGELATLTLTKRVRDYLDAGNLVEVAEDTADKKSKTEKP